MITNRKKQIVIMICIQIGLIIGYMCIHIFVNSNYINIIPTCHIKETYNVLCASCGGTTAVKNMANGNIIEAIRNNGVIAFGIIFLIIIYCIYIIDTINNKEILKKIFPKSKIHYYVIGFVAILVIFTIIRNIIIFR